MSEVMNVGVMNVGQSLFQLCSDFVAAAFSLTEKICSEVSSAANPNARFEKLLSDFQLPHLAVRPIWSEIFATFISCLSPS